ncbi:serine hydrolase domain-containing protein [Streptomyces sp. SL13]|uniref:Serine hydrolase domain-containing protein n=1 Tax=Streptantibioticus silvisoli TaxID=2705255 RepID=A0AA90H1X0_9ACTN|nr:serine hydrolase domain-containing protein [Streptantibioticus silvisoli]MDI5969130.1 serine hydrolase domain-containing protein [Streptantibioticus silvisoli]
MGDFGVEAEAGELGFDARRLERVDRRLRAYVDDGRLPGWLLSISRAGRVAHLSTYGSRDLESGAPVTDDTVWRWYSMSKPVTSVAAMMLYEEGALQLTDPVSDFIPSFADLRVYTGGSDLRPSTVPVAEPPTVWHLLTHTAGLTYGFMRAHPADAIHRARGFEWSRPTGFDLADCCEAWSGIPLLFQPGTGWNYSVATDVLGRVVEVASGVSLEEFFRTRIFEPLGMTEAAFHVPAERRDRLASLYLPGPDGTAVPGGELGKVGSRPPRTLSGGGGLLGTARDYHRFTQMLLGRGTYDGVRLMGSRTVDYMTRNHLPHGADLAAFGRPLFSETPFDGTGFGLGFFVVGDPVALRGIASVGEYGWGGAASTLFWVDPAEEITVSFFTQLLPSGTHPLRAQLRALVHQALVD